MQNRIQSLAEVLSNIFVGFIISYLLVYFVLPLFGLPQHGGKSLLITLIFTAASIIRMYIIRRLFDRKSK